MTAVNGKSTTSPKLIGRFTVDENNGIVEHGEVDVLFHTDGHAGFKISPDRYILIAFNSGAMVNFS